MKSLLRLMAWLSPSFPVGAFGYSHGLEYAVEAGLLRDLAGTLDWLTTLILEGSGRIDADLFLAAHGAETDEDLDRVVDLAAAWRGTQELALESSAQGAAFLIAVSAAWPDPWWEEWKARLKVLARQPAYGVAVAVAAKRAGIAAEPALAAYLHAFAANLVSASVRLVPLGQTDGQRAMAALEAVVLDAVAAALVRPAEDMGAATPMLDWCSMAHETQYTRLFRS
ncbi:urease accessory protein UreF [Paramagnetospirillum kuznetsovii]|uniref:Urease accessory protein UreF n=1 Tax=Paramagnetospirillum kuznetsovii TaxID=2053833 RepID=A0A364NTS5_9PROT|nr:urease accessory UreF family protein [Paramagnetospirillum kuznetsovii]RAU20466.1 urease accessory protein UreF [Paramagnetospirillum kuznetsovii]